MSFIVPGGQLILYKAVPLDNNYENSFRWPNGFTSRSICTYFNNIFEHTPVDDSDEMGKLSYQRVDNQTFKVDVPAWEHYDDNYLIFRNRGNSGGTYDSDRYYFGFITDVLYINDHCTQFTYEIDWLTTWLSYCEFEDCFIERCTPDSDEIGDNIIPEQLECGDYIKSSKRELTFDEVYYIQRESPNVSVKSEIEINTSGMTQLTNFSLVVMICDVTNNLFGTSESLESVDVSFAECTVSGCSIYIYPTMSSNTSKSDIDGFLDQYKQRPQAIINMYMVPRLAVANYEEIGIRDEYNFWKISPSGPLSGVCAECHFNNLIPGGYNADFGGYEPKNNKLYTYPYDYLTVSNGDSEHLDLRFEFFKDFQPTFRIETTLLNPVQVRLIPTYYRNSSPDNLTSTNNYSMGEQLSIAGFPECSWNMDYYSAWVAQNSVPIAVNTGAGLISGAISGVAGLVSTELRPKSSSMAYTAENMGNAGSAIQSAANLFTDFYKASIHADTYSGNLSVGNLNSGNYENTFYGEKVTLNAQMAERIDNFFSMFGYAQKIVANPYDIINGNGRHYCYIKTAGCQAGGKIPTEARDAIERIFNKGIRLWDFVDETEGQGNLGDILDKCENNNGNHHWQVLS